MKMSFNCHLKLMNNDYIKYISFKNSLSNNIDNDLLELKKYCINNNIPIIREDIIDIINLIIKLSNAKNLLELGTAVGYSCINFAKNNDILITTIENNEERIEESKKNISKFNLSHKINLIEQDITDAIKILVKNNEKFNIIFLDAAKGQYLFWLNDIKLLMNNNSILIADNIFNDNYVFESKYSIEKRDRTIHTRMKKFLYNIFNDIELETKILNIGDGISISIKK